MMATLTGWPFYLIKIMPENQPIGIFDSGYGGLTVTKEIISLLPQYDYIYLGDNARTPYGNRSFDVVYQYTFEAVKWLFGKGCHLVILACNTASAKALRTIQQKDLLNLAPEKRVLGVIRPVTESIGNLTRSGHIGILGTTGTISSGSYIIEINHFFPHLIVTQEACPMWVPLVENNEHSGEGADYFIKKHVSNLLRKDPEIDAIILGCTHYPLLIKKIKTFLPDSVSIISQGEITSKKLADYLFRHPEIEQKCSKNRNIEFFTTDSSELFNKNANIFIEQEIHSKQISLQHFSI
jgi:glutamate racemase